METFPPKFSTVLVTPDPHYIPGYAGYCPQLKFHLGETYGQLTAKLLTSPDMMTHSNRLVLHTGRFPSTEEDTGPRDEIWRSFHHGGQRSVQSVIPPGYTGFVPKSQNYFAHTYAETCRRALTEFQRDQEARAFLQSKDLPVLSSHPEFQAQVPTTPLRAITTQPFSYKAESQKDMGSPYFMDDTSPHKYFISGFTGYVPKARFLIGTSYPITTNKALIHFGRQFRGEPTTSLNIPGEICTLPPIPTVYSSTQGLMPSYTGHVPGYKFRYGHTFGQLTHNTLGMGDARRKIEGRS